MAVDIEEATMYQCRGFFVFSFFIKSMYFIIYTYVVRTSVYLLSWFKIRVLRKFIYTLFVSMFFLGLVSCGENATNNASKNTESANSNKKKSACDCFKNVDDPKEFINTVKKNSPCGWLGDKNISQEAIKEINDSMLKNCPDLHKKVFATQADFDPGAQVSDIEQEKSSKKKKIGYKKILAEYRLVGKWIATHQGPKDIYELYTKDYSYKMVRFLMNNQPRIYDYNYNKQEDKYCDTHKFNCMDYFKIVDGNLQYWIGRNHQKHQTYKRID